MYSHCHPEAMSEEVGEAVDVAARKVDANQAGVSGGPVLTAVPGQLCRRCAVIPTFHPWALSFPT